MRTVDLHTHTTFSDGTLQPEELIAQAKEVGLSALAVSDHDTCDGLERAEAAGAALGIEVIRGCELSTMTEKGELHILGLWVPNDPELQRLLTLLQERRRERNWAMLAKLDQLGMPVSQEEVLALAGSGTVGRPHMARAMCAKGYVKTVREAFDRFLGAGCPAFVPKRVLAPSEAVQALAKAGATVSLAHPFLLHFPKAWLWAMIRSLLPFGLDALEVWHTEHTQEDVQQGLAWAKELDLGVSGGSDYHGSNKPGVELGRGRGSLCLSYDLLEHLRARRRAQGLPV